MCYYYKPKLIKNIVPAHLEAVISKFEEMNFEIGIKEE